MKKRRPLFLALSASKWRWSSWVLKSCPFSLQEPKQHTLTILLLQLIIGGAELQGLYIQLQFSIILSIFICQIQAQNHLYNLIINLKPFLPLPFFVSTLVHLCCAWCLEKPLGRALTGFRMSGLDGLNRSDLRKIYKLS